jgi:hypothetical protein
VAFILMNFLQFFAYVFDYESVAIKFEGDMVSFIRKPEEKYQLLIIWNTLQISFAEVEKIKAAFEKAYVRIIRVMEDLGDGTGNVANILQDMLDNAGKDLEEEKSLEMIVKHFWDGHNMLLYKCKYLDSTKFVHLRHKAIKDDDLMDVYWVICRLLMYRTYVKKRIGQ